MTPAQRWGFVAGFLIGAIAICQVSLTADLRPGPGGDS